MYKSFILPQLDYADIVWDNCSGTLSNVLENLHLEDIRIILGAVRGTSHEKLYKESGFCTLKERRKRHKLLMFHKMINHQCPRYLSNIVPPLVSTTNPYHRRRPHERVIPAHKTELYANSFIPSTTQLWNTLPQTIQTNPSISLLNFFFFFFVGLKWKVFDEASVSCRVQCLPVKCAHVIFSYQIRLSSLSCC